MYLLACMKRDHFWSLDLPPTLAIAWLYASWACTGSLLPLFCPTLLRAVGKLSFFPTCGTWYPTLGWHPCLWMDRIHRGRARWQWQDVVGASAQCDRIRWNRPLRSSSPTINLTLPGTPCPQAPHLCNFWIIPGGMVVPPLPWVASSKAWPPFPCRNFS